MVQTTHATIDTDFTSRLTTRANPSFLAALGHHVLPDAPSGSVHGLATPTAAAPRTFAPRPGAAAAQRLVADGPPLASSFASVDAPVAAIPEAAPFAVPASSPPDPPVRPLVDASSVELPAVRAPSFALHPVQRDVIDLPQEPEGSRQSLDVETTEWPPHPTVGATGTSPALVPDQPGDDSPAVAPTIGTDIPSAARAVADSATSAGDTSRQVVVAREVPSPTATTRQRPRIGAPIERDSPRGTASVPTRGPDVQASTISATSRRAAAAQPPPADPDAGVAPTFPSVPETTPAPAPDAIDAPAGEVPTPAVPAPTGLVGEAPLTAQRAATGHDHQAASSASSTQPTTVQPPPTTVQPTPSTPTDRPTPAIGAAIQRTADEPELAPTPGSRPSATVVSQLSPSATAPATTSPHRPAPAAGAAIQRHGDQPELAPTLGAPPSPPDSPHELVPTPVTTQRASSELRRQPDVGRPALDTAAPRPAEAPLVGSVDAESVTMLGEPARSSSSAAAVLAAPAQPPTKDRSVRVAGPNPVEPVVARSAAHPVTADAVVHDAPLLGDRTAIASRDQWGNGRVDTASAWPAAIAPDPVGRAVPEAGAVGWPAGPLSLPTSRGVTTTPTVARSATIARGASRPASVAPAEGWLSAITPTEAQPATPAPTLTRSVAMSATVSRLVAAASSPASADIAAPMAADVPLPWVQRREDDATTVTTAPSAPPAAGSSDAAASSAVTVDTGERPTKEPTDAEIQQLARSLYPQLRRQLGRDLLLDRERLGYRTDIRY